MATLAQMDRLIGRALFDAEFRALLLADPEQAARQLRYRLDGGQIARIRSLDAQALDEIARRFESAIAQPVQSLSFW
ncbi:MAG: hypothetical protein HUU23_10545 [Caldilineales bacterium]|nr:hypothetical protein [Caldilineales bacterium]